MTDADRWPVETEAQADYREWLAQYDADIAAEFITRADRLADRFEAHIYDPRSTQ